MVDLKKPYLDKFLNVIENSTTLAVLSKVEYKKRLIRLTDITGKDVNWILSHCKETMKFLQKFSPETQKGYVNTILTLFKNTKGLKEKHSKVYICWSDRLGIVGKVTNAKYDNIEASQKQIDSFVPWVDVIEKRDKLDKTSEAYLILSMYSMIPPSRADMNHIRIYKKEPSDVEIIKQPNYLIIRKNNTMKLVYNAFKSKGKSIPKYEKELPKELCEVINNSLKRNPREFLIVSTRDGKPYENVNSYTKYVDRTFSIIFGKNVSINTLRHSFVMSIPLDLTPAERQSIALQLMHSESTMQRYRLALPNKLGQECELVCKSKSVK
jgi:integrase